MELLSCKNLLYSIIPNSSCIEFALDNNAYVTFLGNDIRALISAFVRRVRIPSCIFKNKSTVLLIIKRVHAYVKNSRIANIGIKLGMNRKWVRGDLFYKIYCE